MLELDHIIFLLCARGGETPVASMQRCVRNLALLGSTETDIGFETLRALSLLGHAEISGIGQKAIIKVARPALARLPDISASRAVLAGARAGSTVQEIQEHCRKFGKGLRCTISQTLFPSGYGFAQRVVIEADLPDILEEAARAMEIPLTSGPAAWQIACASASVQEIQKNLNWQDGYPIPDEAEYFSPETLKFEEQYDGGVRLARWKQSSTGRSDYAMRKDNQAAPLDTPEWGRHIVLSLCGGSSLRYDPKKRVFAVRATCPLPRLLGRALCLCSGKLPSIVSVRHDIGTALWQRFEDVHIPIAEKIAEHLDQEPGPLPATL